MTDSTMETWKEDRLHKHTRVQTQAHNSLRYSRRKERNTQRERETKITCTRERETQEERLNLLEDKDRNSNIWNEAPTASREREEGGTIDCP